MAGGDASARAKAGTPNTRGRRPERAAGIVEVGGRAARARPTCGSKSRRGHSRLRHSTRILLPRDKRPARLQNTSLTHPRAAGAAPHLPRPVPVQLPEPPLSNVLDRVAAAPAGAVPHAVGAALRGGRGGGQHKFGCWPACTDQRPRPHTPGDVQTTPPAHLVHHGQQLAAVEAALRAAVAGQERVLRGAPGGQDRRLHALLVLGALRGARTWKQASKCKGQAGWPAHAPLDLGALRGRRGQRRVCSARRRRWPCGGPASRAPGSGARPAAVARPLTHPP